MAALRFRFAPPAASHGARGNLALTINTDHSVGAGHIYIGRRFKNDTERLEKLFELYTKMTGKKAS